MKKRGGTNARSGHAGRHSVSARSARKGGSKAGPAKKGKKKSASAAIVSDESREVRSAEQVLKKEEEFIIKELKFVFGPSEFHVVTFVCSLMILSFLFASMSLVFYAVLTIAALLFAHFLRQHHRPHDVLTILGIFFLPLALTLAAFRDLLVWVLLAVYLISALSTVIIYYVHKRAHTPLKIMWQVTYSRVVAVTLALVLACILPSLVFPDAFLSVFEMLFLFVMPVAFLFFFASKFLYIYFFDRVHIRVDFMKSLRHSVIFTLAFIVILMCVYSLFAVGFSNSRAGDYTGFLDDRLVEVANIDKAVAKWPAGARDMMVTQDLLGMVQALRDELSAEKRLADGRPLSFSDLLDDSYFRQTSDDVFSKLRFTVLDTQLLTLKSNIFNRYETLSVAVERDLSFPDGSVGIDAYAAGLRSYVEGAFVDTSQDPAVMEMVSLLNDQSSMYSDIEGGGFIFWFAEETGLDFMYGSGSIFGRQMSVVLRHSELVRQMARLTLNARIFISGESVSPYVVRQLFADREADLLPLSEAVRYGIIRDDIDFRAARMAEADNIDFEVN